MRQARQSSQWHTECVLALHRELPAEGNLPWSPYSVAGVLGLAAAGARGRTYQELVGMLAPGAELAALQRLLVAAAALPDAAIAVAGVVWVDARLRLRDDYQRAVRGWPGGAARPADFRDDPERERTRINDDVAQTTRGLVRELLAPGTVSRETGAVLVNALYLQVAWKQPFEARATKPALFHAPSGGREVPTMHQQETLRYASGGGWRMVTLPTTTDVVVDVLLPDDEAGLAGLTAGTLAALHGSAADTKVDLAVPRFRVEAALVLDDYLRRRGVVAAFTDAADFSGIAEAPLAIDTVVHKAVLRVDEHGFEGAAATAAVMRLTSMDRSRPVPFHVDRPFLVVARHRGSGALYFLARITEP